MFKLNSPEYKGAEFTQILETNIRATLLQGIEHERKIMRGTMKNNSMISSSNQIWIKDQMNLFIYFIFL